MSTTFASGDMANAICDRCSRKVPYKELRPDGNSPGLRVCQDPGCWDMKDPWRLPPIQPDAFVLRFPRTDVPLTINPADNPNNDYPGPEFPNNTPLGGVTS